MLGVEDAGFFFRLTTFLGLRDADGAAGVTGAAVGVSANGVVRAGSVTTGREVPILVTTRFLDGCCVEVFTSLATEVFARVT